jgi:hypothetical protein
MERQVQLSLCKSSDVLYPLSIVPLQGFELSTNGFVDGVYAEVGGEASTAEMVQKFRRALSPQQSPVFKGLNFPQTVLLGGGGWCSEYSLVVAKVPVCSTPSAESPLQGFEVSLMALLMVCRRRWMKKQVGPAELVQKFRRALPPQQSHLFMGLNVPLMVLLMVRRQRRRRGWCAGRGGRRGEYS